MIPFDEALGATLHKLGLAEPALMLDLSREWAEVAGEPWASKATPLYVRSGILVVEGNDVGAVGFLRYGILELHRRLEERFGPQAITGVEVRPPRRRGRTDP
jgi:hypothetical protein